MKKSKFGRMLEYEWIGAWKTNKNEKIGTKIFHNTQEKKNENKKFQTHIILGSAGCYTETFLLIKKYLKKFITTTIM